MLDFGLVKQTHAEAGLDLTSESALAGTPQYLAPESITAPETVDGRADIYALGAVAYYLLTGTPVFYGTTIVEICGQHLHSPPEAPSVRSGRSLPEDLEQLVLRCLEKDPSKRPQSALELQQALESCADAGTWSPDDARRWWAAHGESAPSASPTAFGRTIDIELTSRSDRDPA